MDYPRVQFCDFGGKRLHQDLGARVSANKKRQLKVSWRSRSYDDWDGEPITTLAGITLAKICRFTKHESQALGLSTAHPQTFSC